jgi:8-oxo-dGTP pyrophosphatase MutT (NUDIX family)
LPYRLTKAGSLEILLITSRNTRRWIIPKGWPIKGMKPAKSAAREAYEEAGVRGTVGGKAIGTFRYEKRRDDENSAVPCEVLVFPLLVKRQLKAWPEANERELRWLDPVDAASRVEEDGLRKLINLFTAKQTGTAPEAAPSTPDHDAPLRRTADVSVKQM